MMWSVFYRNSRLLAIAICLIVVCGFSSWLTLPLSILMVLAGMRMLEIPIHKMSLTGLVIALGLLIDNGIVVVDEMQHLLKQGLQPQQAISQVIRYLAIPLSASTLTTVLAFMPMVLLSGVAGEYIRPLGISVILALFGSLLISLTIIPALMGRINQFKGLSKLSKNHRRSVSALKYFWIEGFSHSRITSSYRRSHRSSSGTNSKVAIK